MIQIHFSECQWGVTPLEGGVQINLLHPDSKILAQAPFQGPAVMTLVKLIIEHGALSNDERRELMKDLTPGLELPGADVSIEDIMRGDSSKGGPQG